MRRLCKKSIIYLPDSIDNLINLQTIHLDIDKIKYFSDFVVDLLFKSEEIKKNFTKECSDTDIYGSPISMNRREKLQNTMNFLRHAIKYNRFAIIKRLYDDEYINLNELLREYSNPDKTLLKSLLIEIIIPNKALDNFLDNFLFKNNNSEIFCSFLEIFEKLEYYEKSSFSPQNLYKIFMKAVENKYYDKAKPLLNYIISSSKSRSKGFALDELKSIFYIILEKEDKDLITNLINSNPKLVSSIITSRFFHLLSLNLDSNTAVKEKIEKEKKEIEETFNDEEKDISKFFDDNNNFIKYLSKCYNESEEKLNLTPQALGRIFIEANKHGQYDQAKSLSDSISPKDLNIELLKEICRVKRGC